MVMMIVLRVRNITMALSGLAPQLGPCSLFLLHHDGDCWVALWETFKISFMVPIEVPVHRLFFVNMLISFLSTI